MIRLTAGGSSNRDDSLLARASRGKNARIFRKIGDARVPRPQGTPWGVRHDLPWASTKGSRPRCDKYNRACERRFQHEARDV